MTVVFKCNRTSSVWWGPYSHPLVSVMILGFSKLLYSHWFLVSYTWLLDYFELQRLPRLTGRFEATKLSRIKSDQGKIGVGQGGRFRTHT